MTNYLKMERVRVSCGCVIEVNLKGALLLGVYGARQVPVNIVQPCDQHVVGQVRLCCGTRMGTPHQRSCQTAFPAAHAETHECEEWQFTPTEDLPDRHPPGLRHCRACGKVRAVVVPAVSGRHRSMPETAPYCATRYSVTSIRRRCL